VFTNFQDASIKGVTDIVSMDNSGHNVISIILTLAEAQKIVRSDTF